MNWFWEREKKREPLIPRPRTHPRKSFQTLTCNDCGRILGYQSISVKTIPLEPLYQKVEIECLCPECYQKTLAHSTKKARKVRRSKKKKIGSGNLIHL